MELTAKNGIWLKSEGLRSAVKLPRYLLAIAIIFSGFFIVSISIRVLALTFTEPISHNALFLNADSLVGQPADVNEKQGFSCIYIALPYDASESHCISNPPSGIFAEVRLISLEGITRQIVFTPHQGALRLGHLIWLWGRPEVNEYSRSVYLYWRAKGIFALVPCDFGSCSLSRSVWKVYFFSVPMQV